MSFLSTIGKDIKSVFNWLASPKGQNVVHAAEGAVVAIDPALAGIVGIVDSWIEKIITTETIAAAAGQQDGSGTQKAAAVLNAMQPEINKYFPGATAEQIQNANAGLVTFLNALGTPAAAK